MISTPGWTPSPIWRLDLSVGSQMYCPNGCICWSSSCSCGWLSSLHSTIAVFLLLLIHLMPSCLGPRSSQLYVKGGKSTVIQWTNEDHQCGSCVMDTLSDYFFFWITYSSVLHFHFVKLILMHACLLLTGFAYFLPILSLSPFCAVWYICCWFFHLSILSLGFIHMAHECWNMNKISENCEWFQVSGIKASDFAHFWDVRSFKSVS